MLFSFTGTGNPELYHVPVENYGLQTYSNNPIINGYVHETQMINYEVSTAAVNDYTMSVKQEPDINFRMKYNTCIKGINEYTLSA